MASLWQACFVDDCGRMCARAPQFPNDWIKVRVYVTCIVILPAQARVQQFSARKKKREEAKQRDAGINQ